MLKNYSKLICLCLISLGFGQKQNFNQNEFIKTVRTKYHLVNNDKNDKLICELTSQNFSIYLSNKTNEKNAFPLIVDWTNSNRIQIRKNKFTIDTDDYSTNLEQLILLTRNFFVNWSEFAINKQIPDSAMNYSFTTKGDRVYFSYVYPIQNNFHRVSKEFGLNGTLLKTEIQLQSREIISITPRYQSLGEKLLLFGWVYQKKNKDGVIVEGNEVDVKYKLINKQFYPENVLIKVQISSEPGNVYTEELVFRNFKLNDEEI